MHSALGVSFSTFRVPSSHPHSSFEWFPFPPYSVPVSLSTIMMKSNLNILDIFAFVEKVEQIVLHYCMLFFPVARDDHIFLEFADYQITLVDLSLARNYWEGSNGRYASP